MTPKWKMEQREHCFVIAREGRKANIKIEYGDTQHNIPFYGSRDEARATSTIIEHALNGVVLAHPKDAKILQRRRELSEFLNEHAASIRKYREAMRSMGAELDDESDIEKFETAASELLRNEALNPITPKPFYGAECPSYPNCKGGCGLGCTHEIEGAGPNPVTPAEGAKQP